MKKNIESVRFNMTEKMSVDLIKFNDLKKEYYELKKIYDIDKSNDILLKLNKIEKKMDFYRNSFIKNFKINNQNEINKYLEIKDQKNWSFFVF